MLELPRRIRPIGRRESLRSRTRFALRLLPIGAAQGLHRAGVCLRAVLRSADQERDEALNKAE